MTAPKQPWYRGQRLFWVLAALSAAFLGLWLAGRILRWAWPDGTDWQAIWTFATFLVAIVAAVAALRQLSAHYEAQRDQTRPYVIVDFAFRSQLLMIEIKNIGASPAQNIRLTWSEAPRSTDTRRTDVLDRNLVQGTIPFLAPGRTIRYAVDAAPRFFEATDLPKRFEVLATYRDRQQQYDGERSILALDQWAESLAETDYLKKIADQLEKEANSVAEVVNHVRTISESVQPRGSDDE